MLKHILLISYTFPPYPGIGGRRWAKFAKYLTKLGYTVHVVHAPNPFPEKSLWTDDILNNVNIKRYEVKTNYPIILLSNPITVLQKINYRLSLIAVKFLTKGTPYDRGVFWKKPMLDKSRELIKEFNIKNVIVSCAPFSSAYYAIKLKKYFSNLNLIIDFRDPWTWGKGYGFSLLAKNKLLFENRKENEVVESSDIIFVPASEMMYYLKNKYAKLANKIILLPHAFDTDEFNSNPKKLNDVIRVVFFGTLYDGLNLAFNEINKFLSEFNKQVMLDIYSPTQRYKSLFDSSNLMGNNVNYYSELQPKQLFAKIGSYDFVLILQPDYAKDFITTKIYEIIYSGIPIFLVSSEGKLSDFIVKNNLGIWSTVQDLKSNFQMVLKTDLGLFKLSEFPIHNYSYSSITSNLISHFK